MRPAVVRPALQINASMSPKWPTEVIKEMVLKVFDVVPKNGIPRRNKRLTYNASKGRIALGLNSDVKWQN